SALLGLLAVAALVLVDRSRRSAGVRRGLGIVWDITTFWPRWFHPFAPPSYGERAVPQLAHRVRQIAAAGGSVVMSGHSQGTAVAVAAVSRLHGDEDDSLERVRLITHGSPVGRLYGRFFMRYFSEDLRRSVADVMGSPQDRTKPVWVNLHRKTDYIGGAVFRKGEEPPECYRDEELLDPVELVFEPGERLPKPLRHFDYFREKEYQHVVDEMCSSLDRGRG
ncbi:MAG: PE-PPE domain-containing protein, partial [Acidimicrobiia bacterium]|nr:PE-PPE domain-containing protein [Acidimicrobiia bacterium]